MQLNYQKPSRADQYVISDEIRYSYDHSASYPTDSVVFQGSKSCIGINLSKDDLKAPSTALNGSSSSVIIGITTLFSLQNIYQNDSSVRKRTQFKSTKLFPENYIDIEGTKLMPTFENKLLKNVTIESTPKRQCSTSKTAS